MPWRMAPATKVVRAQVGERLRELRLAFRITQEELAERGDREAAAILTTNLWDLLPDLRFESKEDRGRFLHNFAVFFGNPPPGTR